MVAVAPLAARGVAPLVDRGVAPLVARGAAQVVRGGDVFRRAGSAGRAWNGQVRPPASSASFVTVFQLRAVTLEPATRCSTDALSFVLPYPAGVCM